jgi:sulfotransferase family protein
MNRALVDPVRRAVRSGRAWGRAAVPGGLGRLPEFLIIGGQRCGTTSLYRYLAAHPSVRPATGKELQFLSLYHRRGIRWYRGHFPVRPPGTLSFEASPYYLFDPAVPPRAAALLPSSTRFVALLRDPVERAYSHYLHSRAYGVEPLSFADALDAEPARLASGGHRARRQFSYVARGRYAEQLTRWYSHIPRERLLVVRTEELTARYGDILSFLGLPPAPAPTERHTRRPADSPELTPAIRKRLADTFADDHRNLAALLTPGTE